MTAIVVDSSAYLTQEEARRLMVRIVPLTYSTEGIGLYAEDFIDANGEYETLIDKNIDRMHTSQATPSAFLSAFDDLTAEGCDVLCLTISSRFSGTYANARMAAAQMGGQHVEVVDSLSTGAGLYLLVRRARELLNQGMNVRQAAAMLRAERSRVKTVFSVEDIIPLRRSGRLSGVRLSVSSILNIKPVLKCENGSIVSVGLARGKHERLRLLAREVGAYSGEIVVQSFLADAQAAQICAHFEKSGGYVFQRRIGPVLGIHLGRGSVGITWMERPKQ